MSVLACNRRNCENAMCDYLSYEHGYICYDCLNELKENGPCDIAEFMDSPKGRSKRSNAWDRFVEDEFEFRR